MFSKSDSSSKLRDEILHRNDRTDESGHNKSFQNLFLNTQHNFLNDQKSTHSDNEITLNSIITEASTDVGIMAPQSICFIGDEEDVDEIERNVETMQCFSNNGSVMFGQRLQNIYKTDVSDVDGNKFNIKSGNLTYRIPSPSRPLITPNIFQDPQEKIDSHETGFYIAFDDKQPKRPKPPLRTKRWSKKEKNIDSVDHQLSVKQEPFHQQTKVDDNDLQQNIFNNTKNLKNNNATYNKYTDAPVQSKQLTEISNHNPLMSNIISSDRKHLEDLTNQQQTMSPSLYSAIRENNNEPKGKALVIGSDISTLDAESIDEMERKKEKIMLLSLQRRQQQEETKERKVIEENSRREREREKEEERVRKKEEQKARRAAILEQYRLKNAEREVEPLDRSELIQKQQSQSAAATRLRPKKIIRPRPKTIHVDMREATITSSRGKAGSTTNLTGYGQLSSNSMRRDYYKSSQDLLTTKKFPDDYPSARTSISIVRSDSTSREPTVERGRALSRISATKGNTLNFRSRKSNSLINLRDSGLGSLTPPRRIPSPGTSLSGRKSSSPYEPGSLPPGVIKRRGFDDGLNNIYAPNTLIEYSGPKLYKQPAAKSNRGIIFNAVEYCVFPGAVNRDAKQIVLEKIARSESKHFLVLFRDAGCQFRALYSYTPESNQVLKLYGTGPGQVDEVMFDKFFKYNSGGKCFSQVHTKHLTVTIDAFTIYNSLWQGKKIHLPSKKDMTLLI